MLRLNFFFKCQRVISFVLIFSLVLGLNFSYAQSAFMSTLPEPGTMVASSPAFVPVMIKGMAIHQENPFLFDFLVDSGNTKFTTEQIKQESARLVKYFLAAMTVPQDDLWVNLSPYEADHMIPDALGRTELGRDMLAQDYILKQLSASLLDPEKDLGKEFWARVYKQVEEKFGAAQVPVDIFNKVWIMPEEAEVYEHGKAVYIVKSRLKLMLDQDYKAMQMNKEGVAQGFDSAVNDAENISLQITREIILPEITREVNEGKNFASIRQIYQSLILAQWYKETVKQGLLSKVYIDQQKIKGVDLAEPAVKDEIYRRYVEAFKKGVVNFIKEDQDSSDHGTAPRKYFSGGEIWRTIPLTRKENAEAVNSSVVGADYKLTLRIEPKTLGSDRAMTSIITGNNLTMISQLENAIKELKDVDIKQGGVAFDVDKTLLYTLDDLAKVSSTEKVALEKRQVDRVCELFFYLLRRGAKVAIISGNAAARQWERFGRFLGEYLKERGELNLIQNFTLYADGAASKIRFSVNKDEIVQIKDQEYSRPFIISQDRINGLADFVNTLVQKEDLIKIIKSAIIEQEPLITEIDIKNALNNYYDNSYENHTDPDQLRSVWIDSPRGWKISIGKEAGGTNPWIDPRPNKENPVQLSLKIIPSKLTIVVQEKNRVFDMGNTVRNEIIKQIEEKGIFDLKVTVLRPAGFGSIDIGASKDGALEDFINKNNIKDRKHVVYFGDEFGERGNDVPVVNVEGVHIVNVGGKDIKMEPGHKAKQLLLAGDSPDYTWSILDKLLGEKNISADVVRLTKQQARDLIVSRLKSEYHSLVTDDNIQEVMRLNGQCAVKVENKKLVRYYPLHVAGTATKDLPNYIREDDLSTALPGGGTKAEYYDLEHGELLPESVPEHVVVVPADAAMLKADVGGIAMNKIDVKRQRGGIDVKFDFAAMQNILKDGVEGFTPVIINITPVQSPLMILGVNQPELAPAQT